MGILLTTKTRSGYTVIELLIVCGIIAACACMVYPTVRYSLNIQSRKSVVETYKLDIIKTRELAVTSGQRQFGEIQGIKYSFSPNRAYEGPPTFRVTLKEKDVLYCADIEVRRLTGQVKTTRVSRYDE